VRVLYRHGLVHEFNYQALLLCFGRNDFVGLDDGGVDLGMTYISNVDASLPVCTLCEKSRELHRLLVYFT
jgi:hypothetical protein